MGKKTRPASGNSSIIKSAADDITRLHESWIKLLMSKDVSTLKEGCDICLTHGEFMHDGGGIENLMKILTHQV